MKTVKATIDRFEGEYTVLEFSVPTINTSDTEEIIMIDFPKFLLPENAKEGSILNISLEVNDEETQEQEMKIKNLMDDLFH